MKYRCKTSIALADGTRALRGDVLELSDKVAKPLYKGKAIELYLEDGEELDELPKVERKKVRTGKPAAPATLDDSQLVTPDPRVR